jgi:hypothetical protein
MHREAEASPGLIPAAHVSEVQTKYNAVKSLFEYADAKGQSRVAKQWYMPDVNSIFDMFKDVDMANHYNEGYKPLSGLEHSDAMAYYAMVGESERAADSRELAIQSDLFIPPYLRNAFQYFGNIFTICNKTVALADGKELGQIIDEGMNFYASDMRSKGMPTL